MSKHTIHIGSMHLDIDVEHHSEGSWCASMIYRGEHLEARADDEQQAWSALLAALKTRIIGAGRVGNAVEIAPPITNDNPLLEELKLSTPALSALHASGYRRISDLQHLSNVQILQLANIGGQSYRRILAALGRR